MKQRSTLARALPCILLIGGLIGFAAAAVLTIEKIELIKNPAFEPSCNINPILSCGSVMTTPQAAAFGFPNSLLGLAGFAVVTTVGAALLAGAVFKRWFWLGLQLGLTLALTFVLWLQFQSIYRIGALCPYCIVVWAVIIPIFWYTTLYNLQSSHLPVPRRLRAASVWVQRHHGDILLLWFIALLGIILQHFWYYWSTLL